MKHFLITLVFLTTALFPTSAFADHCTEAGQIHNPENPAFCYTPIPGVSPGTPSTPATYPLMAPLFGEIGPGSSPSLTTYLQGAVQVIIGLAGILAVIMVVVCGIKLMGTPSASGKSEAKECIWNAIFGVLLAIGAWIILYTINPNLLSKELSLADVVVTPPATPAPGTPGGPGDDRYPIAPGWYFQVQEGSIKKYKYAGPPSTGKEACDQIAAKATGAVETDPSKRCFLVPEPTRIIGQDEAGVRIALCGQDNYDKRKCVETTPVGVNALPCASVGSRGCTNVAGLPQSAVDVIKSIQAACNCNVIVSGGTEYWLHATHAADKPIFDIRAKQSTSATLNAFLLQNGTGRRSSFTGYRVFWGGFWWTREAENTANDHWHTCQLGQSYWFCTNVITKGGAVVAP